MNAAFDDMLRGLASDRRVFPHQYNVLTDQILLVELDPAAQDAAGFLDERILPQGARGAWFSRAAVADAAPKNTSVAGYIFHMGHCGSTLISRLVAAASNSAGVREPLPLRALAADKAEGTGAFLGDDDRRGGLRMFERLWGRTPAVVKATSMCTDLISDVTPAGGSVFLYQKPETHLAVLLGGANAATDLRGFAKMRHRRLAQRYNVAPLAGASLGELAALTWATEAMSAASTATPMTMIDFDDFLKLPGESLETICKALGVSAATKAINSALTSPIMRQYSKAPEHDYSADLRARVISQSARQHADEIAKGMTWLDSFRMRNDGVMKVFQQFS